MEPLKVYMSLVEEGLKLDVAKDGELIQSDIFGDLNQLRKFASDILIKFPSPEIKVIGSIELEPPKGKSGVPRRRKKKDN